MSQLGLLDKTKGKILMGGRIDEEVLKVEPAVVLVKEGDVLLESKTFGLILTIVDLEEEGFVRKACDWVSERFTQCYTITANSEESIKASYYDIALKHGLDEFSHWEAGLRWLSQHEEEWIILYDNADDPDLDLGKFLPQSSHGNVIITSRNCSLKQISIKSKMLKDMEPEDGLQLLLKHAIKDNEATPEQKLIASDIAAKMHYFALALVHAGSYISQQNCLDSYLHRLEQHQLVLMTKSLPQSIDNYSLSVYATWDLSWKKLDEQCKTFLRLCSYYHYEGIPRRLFQKALDNLPCEEVVETLAAYPVLSFLTSQKLEWDEIWMDNIVQTISSYSLISVEKGGTYSLHPLVHHWIRDSIESVKQRDFQLEAQSLVAIAIKDADFAFLKSLVPHCIHFEVTEDVHTNRAVGHLWFECGYFSRAYELWEPLWHQLEEKYGERHRLTLDQMKWVIAALERLGKNNEALETAESLLQMIKESFGEEDPMTLAGMHSLSIQYSNMGRWNEALQIDEPLVEMSKKVLGEQHPATLNILNNLANRYAQAGRFLEALQIASILVEVSKKILGEQHPDTLDNLGNLAICYSDIGRYNEALKISEPLVEMSKEIMGEHHPDTLYRIHTLARDYLDIGRYNDALCLQEPLVNISKQILGEQHPVTMQRISNLALSYSYSGRYNEALQLSEPLVKMSVEILGEHHPDTLDKMDILATIYFRMGKFKEALQIGEPLAELSKTVLGEEHPATLTRLDNLALYLSYIGNNEKALQIEEPVLEKCKNLLGEQHPSTLFAMEHLATIYSRIGRYQEALQILEPLVEMCKQTLGEQHPDTLRRIQKMTKIRADIDTPTSDITPPKKSSHKAFKGIFSLFKKHIRK
ncbi:hypothetical protein GYMLUDRAFT_264398 [Collybiopsis luxurians FD-317 M1]|uniref:Kinesin light chain n=1 Tax=Collybiopsis luxurians FD-317 M1 TaxID=944289 RepID=A0A0D0C9X4_9AGAR|nr:hypothetical protein GYMLUDRAFT_264398 [Collybiopsis luxurians FD-317 M1]